MKMKLLIFATILVIFSSCDPSTAGMQIVKNDSTETLIFKRSTLANLTEVDSFQIKSGKDTVVFSQSELGQSAEMNCSDLYFAFAGQIDSVEIQTISGKKLKKQWTDSNNWISKFSGGTRTKYSTSQKCTFVITDDDF